MFLRCRLPRLDTEMSIMVFTSLYVSSEMQMPPGSAIGWMRAARLTREVSVGSIHCVAGRMPAICFVREI